MKWSDISYNAHGLIATVSFDTSEKPFPDKPLTRITGRVHCERPGVLPMLWVRQRNQFHNVPDYALVVLHPPHDEVVWIPQRCDRCHRELMNGEYAPLCADCEMGSQ